MTLAALRSTCAALRRLTDGADVVRAERDDLICELARTHSLRRIAAAAGMTHGGVSDVLRRRGCKESD